MNKNQKAVRWVGALLLLASALVPPWRLAYTVSATGVQESAAAGYHLVWNPPQEEIEAEAEEDRADYKYQVDLKRLGIQLACIFILINAGVYACKERNPSEPC